MKPTDDLFQLVHALTPSEKRYFKINATKHVIGKKNIYEKLFDELAKLPADKQYNENEFKKKHKTKPFAKYYAREKQLLQEMILNAMLAYKMQDESNAELGINKAIREADFFKEKRLITLQIKALDKAYLLAEKQELFQKQIEIISRKFNTLIENKQADFYKIQDQFDTPIQALLEKNKQLTLLNFYSSKALLYLRFNFDAPADLALKINALLEVPIIKNYKEGTSFRTDISYYSILARIERANKRKAGQNHYNEKMFNSYQKNKAMQETNGRTYRTDTYNYLNSLLNLDDFKTFEKVLKVYKEIPVQNKDDAGEQWQNTMAIEILYYLNSAQYASGSLKYNEVIEGLKTYAHKVNTATKMALLFNLIVCLFIEKKQALCITINNLILQDKSDAREDIKRESVLIEVMLHFCLKNNILVQSLVRGIKRKAITKEEKIYLDFFEKATKDIKLSKETIIATIQIIKEKSLDNYNTTFGLWLIWLVQNSYK